MIDPVIHNLDTRLSEQERDTAVLKAVTEERRKHMDDRFDKLESKLIEFREESRASIAKIQGLFEKLLMLVAASIIGYIVKWLVSGGLSLTL